MREIVRLTRLAWLSAFGINRYRHTRDHKEKRRFRLLAAAVTLVAVVMGSYIVGLVYGLVALELSRLVPAYLVMLTSLFLVILGLFRAGNTLYTEKGLPLFSSLPLKPASVVLSRFLTLYTEDLLLSSAILACGLATYAVLCRPAWNFYPTAVLGALLLPAIPTALTAAIGTLTTALAARTQHKSLWQSGLTVTVVLAVIIFPTVTQDGISLDQITQLAHTVNRLIAQLYPPAVWLGDALTGDGLRTLWLFVGVSVGALTLAVWLVTRYFTDILARLHNTGTHRGTARAAKRQGLTRALTVREARRYFSSSVYVTNTIVGPLLSCILVGAVCFSDTDAVIGALPLPVDLAVLTPLAFAAVCGMMTPAAVALSMEGKYIWQIKSLPIPAKALFDSKLLFSAWLIAPFYAAAEGLMLFFLRPHALDGLLMLLMPAVILLFSLVCGLGINRRLHRFDWEKDEEIVKQSAPAALGGFLCPLACSVIIGGCVLLPANSVIVRGAAAVILLSITAAVYRRNSHTDIADL